MNWFAQNYHMRRIKMLHKKNSEISIDTVREDYFNSLENVSHLLSLSLSNVRDPHYVADVVNSSQETLSRRIGKTLLSFI